MRGALLKPVPTRRLFMGWLVAVAPVLLGMPLVQIGKKSTHFRLGREFLVVDGWVLPSSHFD